MGAGGYASGDSVGREPWSLISEATRDSGRRTAESSLMRSLLGDSMKGARGTRDRVMVNDPFALRLSYERL